MIAKTSKRQQVYHHIRSQLPIAAQEIRQASDVLVTMHIKPDGDAIGSAIAMVHMLVMLGKTATLYNPDGIEARFAFLEEELAEENRCQCTVPASQHGQYDLCIVLDCATPSLLAPSFRAREVARRVLYIDHHKNHYTGADCTLHDAHACAVGEILYWLARELNVSLTQALANALYTSITTDTGSFRYRSATPSAFDVAASLVEAGADVWYITSNVYEKNPSQRIHLLALVLNTLWISPCQRIACLNCTMDALAQTGCSLLDTDGFINHARSIDGVEVAVFISELPSSDTHSMSRYRISFRSRGNVDVSKLAENFGGGGHVNAAACIIENKSVDEIRLEILWALQELEKSGSYLSD